MGEAILPLYQDTLRKLEEIIRREKLVTLPQRPARIRLATPGRERAAARAEHAAAAAGRQHRRAGRVRPAAQHPGRRTPASRRRTTTSRSTRRRGRSPRTRRGRATRCSSPAMIETGVSTARAVFALQQHERRGLGPLRRADRAAVHAARGPADLAAAPADARRPRVPRPRAAAGPDRRPEQAKALLMDDVVLSEAMATQEVERYTFRAPGQATTYFYGYTRLHRAAERGREGGWAGASTSRRSTTSCCRRACCRRRSCARRCWMVSSAGRPRRERRPSSRCARAGGGQILMKMPFLYIQ